MRSPFVIISAAAFLIGSSIATSNSLNIPKAGSTPAETDTSIAQAAFHFRFKCPSWFRFHFDPEKCVACVNHCNETCPSPEPWFECMWGCSLGPCNTADAKQAGKKGGEGRSK